MTGALASATSGASGRAKPADAHDILVRALHWGGLEPSHDTTIEAYLSEGVIVRVHDQRFLVAVTELPAMVDDRPTGDCFPAPYVGVPIERAAAHIAFDFRGTGTVIPND